MKFEYIVIEIGWSPKLEYIRIPVYISLSQVTPVMSQGWLDRVFKGLIGGLSETGGYFMLCYEVHYKTNPFNYRFDIFL